MKIRTLFSMIVLALGVVGCRTSSTAMVDDASFSASERAALEADLDQTRDLFLRSVSGLTEEQLYWKASPDKWSVAQVAEHITAAESFIRGAIEESMKAPASAEMLADARKEKMIRQMITDRSRKFEAPEPIQPTNRFGSVPATIAKFKTERAKTEQLVHDGGDLRLYAADHPAGHLDAVGWFYFLSGHTERHVKQIEELKAMPDFPRGS